MTVFVGLTGAALAAGHHSYADVMRDQSVSVAGTLTGFLYANPHTMLTIETEGSGTYSAEWQTIHQLSQAGIRSESFKVGDHVVVTGSPSQRSDHLLKLLTEVRRPSDGFLWSVPLGRRGGPEIPQGSIQKRTVK